MAGEEEDDLYDPAQREFDEAHDGRQIDWKRSKEMLAKSGPPEERDESWMIPALEQIASGANRFADEAGIAAAQEKLAKLKAKAKR